MKPLITFLTALFLTLVTYTTHAQTVYLHRFDKVTISPYIQASFVEGDEEKVEINSIIVDSTKLHMDVDGGNLRVYLEGAKEVPHQNPHLYPDHSVVITVTYRKLTALSLRGSEKYLCQSPLSVNKFALHLYGEPTVIFTEVHIARMHTTLYGDGSLDIRSGDVNKQYYTCYGQGKINSTAISGWAAHLTAFGESEFRVNVSHRIKITAFGEAKLRYLGNPAIVKGIHLGEVDLRKLD